MVKFDHEERQIQKSFNLTQADITRMMEVLDTYLCKNEPMPITKFLERIWVDEVMSDNLKCYLLFTTGRHYEVEQNK